MDIAIIVCVIIVSICLLVGIKALLSDGDKQQDKKNQNNSKNLKLIQCAECVHVHDQYGIWRGTVSMELLLCHNGEKYFVKPLVDPRCPIEDVQEAVQRFEHLIFDDPECPSSLDELEDLCTFIRNKYKQEKGSCLVPIIHNVKERKQ